MKTNSFALLALLLVIPLASCQEGDEITNVEAPPAPTEPVTVLPAGACDTEATSINCCDESKSAPPGELANVRWRLFRGSATLQQTKNASPGDCITFGPALALDFYSVEQRVEAKDGSSATVTYSNLEVDGV